MKKALAVFLHVLICMSLFAQITYEDLGDSAGSCVVYQESTGNLIHIINAADYYIIQYRDIVTNHVYSSKVSITKGFITEITYLESIEGTKEDFDTVLLPKIQNLFFYTDRNMRNNLPSSFATTKTDLFSGTITRSGVVDFYIPITNLVYEEDENKNIITKCVQFGKISPHEKQSFLNTTAIPQPVIITMEKAKLRNSKKITYNNFKLRLPANWKLDKGYYVFPGKTKQDAILFTEKISLEEMQLSDFYAYIMLDLLRVDAFVIPDSFEMEIIGNAACITYDVADYTFFELNTCKIALFSDDGIHFDVLRINGYSQFIEQNLDMIHTIIKTAQVK